MADKEGIPDKMKYQVVALAAFWGLGLRLCPAQTFQNLDFEWATPVLTNNAAPLQGVTPESAFPNWQVKQGVITLDSAFPEGGHVVLISRDVNSGGGFSVGGYGPPITGPVEGAYSLYLQGRHGDWNGMGGGDDPGRISQTGLVPLGTTTLTFLGWEAGSFSPGSSLDVFMAGQSLVLTEGPSVQPDISLFSADVGPWAGQVVELEFVARIPPVGFPTDGVWKGAALIDSIVFIPEPASLTLAGLGLMVLVLFKRRSS